MELVSLDNFTSKIYSKIQVHAYFFNPNLFKLLIQEALMKLTISSYNLDLQAPAFI